MNFNPTGDSYCKTHGWLRCTCPADNMSINYVHCNIPQDPNNVWQHNVQPTGIVGTVIFTSSGVGTGIFRPGFGSSGIFEPEMRLIHSENEEDIYGDLYLEKIYAQRMIAERRLRFLPKFIKNWMLGIS